jgi:type II secretory pathway pseudopilin PulG
VSGTAVIAVGARPLRSTLLPRLRRAGGFGLVELLIALLVLNIGIFAIVAAFNAGALAIRRASRVSAAAAVADKQMEAFRDSTYAGILAIPTTPPTIVTGPDGRQYQLAATVTQTSQKTGAGVAYPGSSTVKLVTVTVRDVADANKLLVTNSSTFEQCAQDRTSTACGGS